MRLTTLLRRTLLGPVDGVVAAYLALCCLSAALLSDFIYWDDWVIFGADPDLTIERFVYTGIPFAWNGWLLAFAPQDWVPFYRLAALLAWLGVCAAFAYVVNRVTSNKALATLVMLVALVAPLNAARTAVINMPAMLCLASFFVGWMGIRRSTLLASLAFLFSFTMPSLLFLFAAPYSELLWHHWRTKTLWQPTNMVRLAWFAALPPAYWLVKSVWFQPWGVYTGYNSSITLLNVAEASDLVWADLAHIATNLEWGWFVAAALSAALFWPLARALAVRIDAQHNPWSFKPGAALMLATCGGLLVALAVIPYLLVGNPPRWAVWDSRNQVLVPFGFSLLVVAAVRALSPANAARLLALYLGICLVFWGGQTYLLWRDGEKQEAIQQLWAAEPEVEKAHIIVLDDRSQIPFANRRKPGWYELSGLLANHFGNERRVAIEISQWTNDLCAPQAHLRFSSPYYRNGDVSAALAESPMAFRIIRTELTMQGTGRPWWVRIFRPTQGLQMTVEHIPNYCPAQAARSAK